MSGDLENSRFQLLCEKFVHEPEATRSWSGGSEAKAVPGEFYSRRRSRSRKSWRRISKYVIPFD